MQQPRALIGAVTPLPEEPEREWTAYLLPFVRRWKLFLAVFLVTLGAVLVFTLQTPKTYITTVKLMAGNPSEGKVSSSADGDTLPVLNAILGMTGQQSAETYADLLQEPPLADAVISQLGLKTNSTQLLRRVTVKPVTNTAIVSVSVSWPKRDEAARIANAFADLFVVQQRELVQGQADSALTFLDQQLPKAARRLRAAQKAEADYESKNNVADVTAQTAAMLQQIATLDSKISETKLGEQQTAASLAKVNELLAGRSATVLKEQNVAPNALRATLETQRAQLELQLKTAEGQYTSAHPVVSALRGQLQNIDRQIAAQPSNVVSMSNSGLNPLYQELSQQRDTLQAQASSSKASSRELEAQRTALLPALRQLPQTTASVFDLKRETKEAQDVYSQLRAKYTEASLERTTVPDSVAIVVRATPDGAVVLPSFRVNAIVGLLLALGLGTTAVYLAHVLDHTLKDERDIESELSLPVLTHVPLLDFANKRDADTLSAMSVEAFLQLIWSMRYASDEPIRSLAVCSASAGEGKSTIALNAAAVLADAFPGVLLIDADMRRPQLHAKLGMPRSFGLAEILAGGGTLAQVVRQTKRPGLFLLAAGAPVPNPVKLLQSDRFSRLLEEASKSYSMVIVDTPALNIVFDGAVACAKTDATVLVVSSKETDIAQAKRALRRLAFVNVDSVIGVVLNRAKPPAADYSGYYGGAEQLPRQFSLPGHLGDVV